MFTITKEFCFEAAHSLPHLPEGHRCRNSHGHSYRVIVELSAEKLDARGFVADYGDLDWLKIMIDRELDHTDLNEAFDFPTTAENIAKWFFEFVSGRYPHLKVKIGVSETAKTWAWIE